MNVTDEQLLDFRDAVKRSDHAAVRGQNPRECDGLTDEDLAHALLHRAGHLLTES